MTTLPEGFLPKGHVRDTAREYGFDLVYHQWLSTGRTMITVRSRGSCRMRYQLFAATGVEFEAALQRLSR